MLPFHPTRLIIVQHRIDFRRQWNGLLGECNRLGFDPYSGDCVVFVKWDRTQLRALSGDGRGLFIVARRFDGGRLALSWVFQDQPTTQAISAAEVAMLLEGASFTVHKHVKNWRK